MAGFAFPLPFTVISELLGVPEPDRADLGRWFRTLLAPYPGPQPPAEAVAASDMIVGYLTALLDRKRTAPGEDLVTDLVDAADRDGALSRQEMLSTIFQLVVAGHDTTTSLIGNGTVALLRHPEQRDALVADPGLVPRVGRGVPALGRAGPALHVPLHHRGAPHRRGRHPGLRAGHRLARGGQPRSGPLPRPGLVRHPTAPTAATSPSATASTSASAPRWPGWRPASPFRALHTRFPAMRLAVDPSQLRWGHGDGLVLRGLTELPVVLGPSGVRRHSTPD